jgi:hypothetical protein
MHTSNTFQGKTIAPTKLLRPGPSVELAERISSSRRDSPTGASLGGWLLGDFRSMPPPDTRYYYSTTLVMCKNNFKEHEPVSAKTKARELTKKMTDWRSTFKTVRTRPVFECEIIEKHYCAHTVAFHTPNI